MTTVLVTGAAGPVADVAEAGRAHGGSAVEVADPAGIREACARAGRDAFDAYVQLPVAFELRGDTAVQRMHHLYGEGILARFPAMDAALPALTERARVTFVL